MKIISFSEAKSLGVKRYFTGIACPKNHIAERSVSSRGCVECASIKIAEYRIKNRKLLLEKKRVYAKKQRLDNPEHVYEIAKKSVQKHKIARNVEKAAWARKNHSRVLGWCRQRQLAKIQRTPSWLSDDELWMIEQAYELAALRTKMFGFAWHVDHVIPLCGKKVSGLHTPYNLQVIPAVENLRKSNRMEIA